MLMTVALLIVCLHAATALVLVSIGGITRHGAPFMLLALALWLFSFPSAGFVWWAWLERGAPEKWAMYGVFYFSAPIIASNAAAALLAVAVALFRKIEGSFRLFLYALLLFLALQVVMSVWAA